MQTRTCAPSVFLVLLLLGTAGTAFAEVILTTDKPTYEVGEIVHLTAYNTGPMAVDFLSYPFFVIFNLDTGECIRGGLGLPVLTPFPVGETVSTDWNTGFRPDVPGNYSVRAAVIDWPATSYVLTYPVSAEVNSWGTIKALYR